MWRSASASAGAMRLQWGRDRSVAEIQRTYATSRSAFVLQWGRDRSVAEINKFGSEHWFDDGFNGAATDRSRKYPPRPKPVHPGLASMGPRPIGRGNPRKEEYQCRNAYGLQWGRDRSVAEIHPSPEDELCSLFASMGPRPIGRGNSNSRVRQKHGGSLQWGRDRSVAEIPPPPPTRAKAIF